MRFGILVTLAALGAPGALAGQRVEVRALSESARSLAARTDALADQLSGLRSLSSLQSLSSLRSLGLAIDVPAVAALGLQLGDLDQARFGRSIDASPPRAWDAQDPADSIYREARTALNRGNYDRAIYLFNRIYDRYPRSSYAPDAFYWEAFARYRAGGSDNLQSAKRLLTRQRDRYPDAATREDANSLMGRVNAALARDGDQEATREIQAKASETGEARRLSAQDRRDEAERVRNRQGRRSACGDDDDDERMAALNALLQMDADRALPILRKVMVRRDEGSVCLRRKAVFLISQHAGEESESMLLSAVRSDPDPEVREQAVFWLGQSGGERAAVALDSILRASDDPSVQDKAIFALSQNSSPRALQSLRDYAMKSGAPSRLRENAIFWLGQSGRGENVDFLKTIFRTVREESLKDKIIFSISQSGGRESRAWLTEVAGNNGEDIEIRKKAIFWLGQSGGASLPELFTLYERSGSTEIKEQLIFAYSQRNEKAAVDKLVDIARHEKDRELRKKAMFWLSQSHDPRVAEILEEILSKP